MCVLAEYFWVPAFKTIPPQSPLFDLAGAVSASLAVDVTVPATVYFTSFVVSTTLAISPRPCRCPPALPRLIRRTRDTLMQCVPFAYREGRTARF